jgi:hypothetical protein
VPNDGDFGAVTAVCDPYLTQMEISETRYDTEKVGCGGLQPSERTLDSFLFCATPESPEENTVTFNSVWNGFSARVGL